MTLILSSSKLPIVHKELNNTPYFSWYSLLLHECGFTNSPAATKPDSRIG
jgi:hypothetical protein